MKYVREPGAALPQKARNPHSGAKHSAAVQEYGQPPTPTDYIAPRTIRPYSLGQNREWDAVSRMLAAGLVTVCPDPMGMGFVRVCAVPATSDKEPRS